MKDLHILPKVRDSWSFLYLEHCKIDQDAKAIAAWDESGKTPIPIASLTLLMLGPGTSITHAAIQTIAEHGTMVVWSGEQGVRYYAMGDGETRSALHTLRQAAAWANPVTRLEIVKRMYRARFDEVLPDNLTIQQLRGREGARVRDAYARASRETGVPWSGRSYRRDQWQQADPVNRALSAANACLYGLVQAAIVSAGYSPAIGFVHTGKQLAFVYDIADLYKVETTIPAAFEAAKSEEPNLERRVRLACRDHFRDAQLLKRIISDIHSLFSDLPDVAGLEFDSDEALPGGLWDPVTGQVPGGANFADPTE
jgi:CRISPR-associated protein Cas1